jgi:lambda family phage portal protein
MAFDAFRLRLARMIAPPRKGTRMYAGARMSRLTSDWQASSGSADSELWSSLVNLRNRSRQLIRDNAYAKRAKLLVVNNVIGGGIGMEPQVRNADGGLNKRVNAAIERAWDDWCRPDSCHTGGVLSFSDFERQAFGQIFEAGEVFPRKHYLRFGESPVPLALELIEAERMADDLTMPTSATTRNYRMGIERDEFGRATDFWIRKSHPGEFKYASGGDDPNTLIKVPADQMFHLYICDRWPQTRGEPWLHAAMRRLNDMDGYAEAEIIRARAAACRFGIIQSPDSEALPNDQTDPTAQPQFDLEPGMVQRLGPGETWVDSDPSSPNAAADPFMRLLLREVAAGIGVSYASMSMDYSQSNYSSSRLALLDDRDLWRVFQQYFIRSFREPLHRQWLRQAVMSRAIPEIDVAAYAANARRFEQVTWQPRGWNWIDPEKEVNSYIAARRAGLMSSAMIVSQTGNGNDLEDIYTAIASENKDAKDKGVVLTVDPDQILARGESDPNVVPAEPPKAPEKSPEDKASEERREASTASVVASVGRAIEQMSGMTAAIASMGPPVVNIAPQPVHINTPDV